MTKRPCPDPRCQLEAGHATMHHAANEYGGHDDWGSTPLPWEPPGGLVRAPVRQGDYSKRRRR
jgi:hypothetical protein